MTQKQLYQNHTYGNLAYRKYVYKDYIVLKLKLGLSIVNYSYIIIDKGSGEAAVLDPAWEPEKPSFEKTGIPFTRLK